MKCKSEASQNLYSSFHNSTNASDQAISYVVVCYGDNKMCDCLFLCIFSLKKTNIIKTSKNIKKKKKKM